MSIDALDARLIGLLRSSPNLAVVEMARRLEVARGTVQARVERLTRTGVITGFGPDVAAPAAGFGVLAFTTLEIAQGSDEQIIAGLEPIAEVLEVHAVTGPGDLHLRVVASSNDHLHDVLQRILALPGITRTETQLALHTAIDRSIADLVARGTSDGDSHVS
ncbi:Lrp/AsnC family transcriptional regulator [Ilumatobacter sp.]|uniref:Lrp/AsnC family transcriptional regulator n=1 Tax=Ilumatobacter sp. TaxID=1967498 RepID=UPI003C38A62F